MQKQPEDKYKTIKRFSRGLYKDKGSKFIALAFPVKNEDEVKELLAKTKKEYHDARHHCYAWVVGYENAIYRFNDDGEPPGTAGKPIYGQILSHELFNVLIIVVRYFGGTKLGVRGLINAYKGAAKDAIDNNSIVNKTIRNYYKILFDYLAMNDIMRIMKEYNLTQHSHNFDQACRIDFSVRKNQCETVISQFTKLPDVRIEFLFSE